MATENTKRPEVLEVSVNQDIYLVSPSCRILQDLGDMHINPEESVSIDTESARLQNELNSETPNKYPNAPHPSPIDLQNNADSSVFNEELVKCLNELPVILLNLEERTKDGSAEVLEIDKEYPPRSYFAASSADSNVETNDCERFQYKENAANSCSVKTMTVAVSNHMPYDDKRESKSFSANNSQLERFNFLTVDSLKEFSRDFYKRSSLKDNASLIVNCSDDASDMSLDNIESVSSDDGSSCASRDRIEFEALALDSRIHPSTFQRFQHWRTLGRNKRALSLDEVSPSKILHTTDFSKSLFELAI